MGLVKKLLAVFLGVVALVVAVHFMFASFYAELVDVGPAWDVVNWFMAVGIVVALLVSYLRKRALDRRGADGSVSREYLEANLVFYVTVMLVIWFFWNWTDDLTAGGELQGQTHSNIWVWIDPLFVVIAGVTARYLWRTPFRD